MGRASRRKRERKGAPAVLPEIPGPVGRNRFAWLYRLGFPARRMSLQRFRAAIRRGF